MVCQTIDRFEVNGKKTVVLAAPGDRRDEDIRAIAQEAAGHFDCYILKADDNRRGRDEREVPLMLQQQLIESGVKEQNTQIVSDETQAIETALQQAQEGDLVLIFGDDITRSWKQIIGFNTENQKPSEPSNDTHISSVIINQDEKEFIESMDLIKDERGVRLARIEEDGD